MGRFTVNGHEGQNELRFTGRLGNRRLRSGEYTISPVTIKGARPSRPAAVGVAVRGRGSRPAKVIGTCAARIRQEELATSARVDGLDPSAPRTRPSAAVKTETRKQNKGVLGVFRRPRFTIPDAAENLPWLVGIAALSLLFLSGAAILSYVVRYLRRVNA
jgi:hypothetical protein